MHPVNGQRHLNRINKSEPGFGKTLSGRRYACAARSKTNKKLVVCTLSDERAAGGMHMMQKDRVEGFLPGEWLAAEETTRAGDDDDCHTHQPGSLA